MGESYPQPLACIKRICKMRHLNEKDVYRITKKLLEMYRDAIWASGEVIGGVNSILQNEGKEEVRQWYLKLEDTESEDTDEKIERMIFHVCRTDWVGRVINCVMIRVKEFHYYGDIYFEILNKSYFLPERRTDQEVIDEVALERATYYRRKKEAVLLAGILLWEEAKNRKFA